MTLRLSILSVAASVLGASAQDIPDLSRVREVNLDRAAKLPNFVADEIATRYRSKKTDPPEWKFVDTVRSEIAMRGRSGFLRRNVQWNGKPWNKPGLPNYDFFHWRVAFGEELIELFDPRCRTEIEFEGGEEWNGKTMFAYTYHSPKDGCFGELGFQKGPFPVHINPPRKGSFLIEASGLAMIRFKEEAVFPERLNKNRWTVETSWNRMNIGGESYVLPVSAELTAAAGEYRRASVEYKNHRHFEATSNVTFK